MSSSKSSLLLPLNRRGVVFFFFLLPVFLLFSVIFCQLKLSHRCSRHIVLVLVHTGTYGSFHFYLDVCIFSNIQGTWNQNADQSS